MFAILHINVYFRVLLHREFSLQLDSYAEGNVQCEATRWRCGHPGDFEIDDLVLFVDRHFHEVWVHDFELFQRVGELWVFDRSNYIVSFIL